MRIVSIVLAFAFLFGGPSLAGSADASLPSIGSFAYGGSPVAASHAAIVVAVVR